MFKTLLLIIFWFYGFLIVLILLAQASRLLFKRQTPEPRDEEIERWRRAFEGTDYEWDLPEKAKR